ncbi:MAG TPA: heme-copper oxidase subunit III [Halococcus sp.]|nr:heme-copper oxidase subunit III [Halococcus sp.]
MGTTNEAVEQSEGQEPPAGADFPTGKSESTWWPIMCMLGIFGIYMGAGLYFFGNGGIAVISPIVGPIVFFAGAFTFLGGLFGWLYHAFVIDYWPRSVSKRKPRALRGGMLLFLTTDVATFSGGFIYYVAIRGGGWPPANLPGLLSPVLLVNTVALVLSSFTMHFAHKALEDGNRTRFLSLLASTLVLGVLFVLGQVFEFYGFIIEDGFTLSSGVFGSAFFPLVGLHGLHVTLGTILLAILLIRGLFGQYSDERDTSIVTVSFYWHFVDIVWLILVTIIYWTSSITTVPFQ